MTSATGTDSLTSPMPGVTSDANENDTALAGRRRGPCHILRSHDSPLLVKPFGPRSVDGRARELRADLLREPFPKGIANNLPGGGQVQVLCPVAGRAVRAEQRGQCVPLRLLGYGLSPSLWWSATRSMRRWGWGIPAVLRIAQVVVVAVDPDLLADLGQFRRERAIHEHSRQLAFLLDLEGRLVVHLPALQHLHCHCG